MPALSEIAQYLDDLLRVAEIPDYPSALNGLQVESAVDIVRIAAAVDARERTIRDAVTAGANLLLVHHGLFWSGLEPLRGPALRRVQSLVVGRLALYSAHLPLDAHPTFGNNVLLAKELGLTPAFGFARHQTVDIGVGGESDTPTADIIARAASIALRYGGMVRHTTCEPGRITTRWAVCTGAGASRDTIKEAAARRVDTLIVGEGPHWTAIDAEELGITIIYAGHYATETFGVRALAEHVSSTFEIPWTFLHAPTGL
ncbi:MAG TPA: Nif3-like dinuclear metal center hexameric protein [Gemmatimonadaceae bacterium]|nr:Nif3-like dinuclear metal center hexameric protein [Gemmatimonadaceae bacterium]